MRSWLMSGCLLGTLVVFVSGCSDPEEGAYRGRIGAPGQGGATPTVNRFNGLTPPPGFSPRTHLLRWNPELQKQRLEERQRRGDFNPAALPTLAALREIHGKKEVSLILEDGRVVSTKAMCLMTDGIAKTGSALSLSAGPCPKDDEAMRDSLIPLSANEVASARPSTVKIFEIQLDGKAIGRFMGNATFAKHPNGTFFPQGAMRYTLIEFCTTSSFPEFEPRGLEAVDYEQTCKDMGLIS